MRRSSNRREEKRFAAYLNGGRSFFFVRGFIISPIGKTPEEGIIADYMEVRTSQDMINWSEPVSFEKDGKRFGNHYQAIISYHGNGNPSVVTGNSFTVMECHNGTDVRCHDFRF